MSTAKTKPEVVRVEAKEEEVAPEPKKVMLFSKYPVYDLVIKPAKYRQSIQNDILQDEVIPGKAIRFKKNKALVSQEVADDIRGRNSFDPVKRALGVAFWFEDDLRKDLKNPAKRGWAKKVRAEIERRRTWYEEQPNTVDFFAIMDEDRTHKIGRVETTK